VPCAHATHVEYRNSATAAAGGDGKWCQQPHTRNALVHVCDAGAATPWPQTCRQCGHHSTRLAVISHIPSATTQAAFAGIVATHMFTAVESTTTPILLARMCACGHCQCAAGALHSVCFMHPWLMIGGLYKADATAISLCTCAVHSPSRLSNSSQPDWPACKLAERQCMLRQSTQQQRTDMATSALRLPYHAGTAMTAAALVLRCICSAMRMTPVSCAWHPISHRQPLHASMQCMWEMQLVLHADATRRIAAVGLSQHPKGHGASPSCWYIHNEGKQPCQHGHES